MREVLSDHERNMLRVAGKGKSLSAMAQLYRQYEGENGVRDALAKIREKVEKALQASVEQAHEPSEFLEDTLSVGERMDEAEASVPVKSAPHARVPDAGAGSPPTCVEATPPRVPAPASAGSTRPSRTEFNGNRGAPAGLKRLQVNRRESGERQTQIVALLSVQRMSAARLGQQLGIGKSTLSGVLCRMEDLGIAKRSTANAYDWEGADRGKGRPSRVWMLMDEPEGCLAPAGVSSHTVPMGSVRVSSIPADSLADDGHELAPVAEIPSDNCAEQGGGAERKGIVAGGPVRDIPGIPVGMGSLPPLVPSALDELPNDRATREEYLGFLWACAWREPHASHIFDRIERMTGLADAV